MQVPGNLEYSCSIYLHIIFTIITNTDMYRSRMTEFHSYGFSFSKIEAPTQFHQNLYVDCWFGSKYELSFCYSFAVAESKTCLFGRCRTLIYKSITFP